MDTFTIIRRRSLYQTILVVCVVLILITLFLEKTRQLDAWAEWVRLDTTLANLQTDLNLRAAVFLLRGRSEELSALDGSNPLAGNDSLMEKSPKEIPMVGRYVGYRPVGYVGEFDFPDPVSPAAGQWYFDRGKKVLVYRVRHPESLRTRLPGTPRIRFRVSLGYRDENGNGRFDAATDRFEGVRLVPLDGFSWRDPG